MVDEYSDACQASFSALLSFPSGIRSLYSTREKGEKECDKEYFLHRAAALISSFLPLPLVLGYVPLLDKLLFLEVGYLSVGVIQEQAGDYGDANKLEGVLREGEVGWE